MKGVRKKERKKIMNVWKKERKKELISSIRYQQMISRLYAQVFAFFIAKKKKKKIGLEKVYIYLI